MHIFFLKLNIKRIFRTLKVIGIIRVIILAFMFLLFYFVGFSSLLDNNKTYIISLLIVTSIFSIHINRKDKKFLKSILVNSYFVYITQYLLIILPFLVAMLISSQYIPVLLILFTIFIISLNNKNFEFKSGFQERFKIINFRILNSLNFEWYSGLRQNWFLVLVVYICSFALAKYELGIIIPIAINALIITSFYMESESELLLNGFMLSAKKYLVKKIVKAIVLFNLIYSPVYLLYVIIYYEHFFFIIFVIFAVSILLPFSILTKYSTYEPNQLLKGNIILIVIFCLCFTKPFLFPIPIFLIIRNYIKALNNLKNYMYVVD